MIAPLVARLSELERRFELLRRQVADLHSLAEQLRQRTGTGQAANIDEDRLARAGSAIGARASGSLTYYQRGSVSNLTDPAETVTATNPHPSVAVPSTATCIVGVVNGVTVVKGWFCS